jgi:hypothetical protein
MGNRNTEGPAAGPQRIEKVAEGGAFQRIVEPADGDALPQPVAPAGLARRWCMQDDEIDVGVLRRAEDIEDLEALLGTARGLEAQ